MPIYHVSHRTDAEERTKEHMGGRKREEENEKSIPE